MKGTLAARTQVPPMVYGVSEDFKQKKKSFVLASRTLHDPKDEVLQTCNSVNIGDTQK
jgi:hypothetical protein